MYKTKKRGVSVTYNQYRLLTSTITLSNYVGKCYLKLARSHVFSRI